MRSSALLVVARAVARAVALVVALVATSGCPAPTPSGCNVDDDCVQNELCRLGACVPDDPVGEGEGDAGEGEGEGPGEGEGEEGFTRFPAAVSIAQEVVDLVESGDDTPPDLVECTSTAVPTDADSATLCGRALPIVRVRQDFGLPDLAVFVVRNLAVPQGTTLRFVGDAVPVLAVFGDATLEGVIDVSAAGEVPGAGAMPEDVCTIRTGGDGGVGGDGGAGGGGGAGSFSPGGAGGSTGATFGLGGSPAPSTGLVGGCPGGDGGASDPLDCPDMPIVGPGAGGGAFGLLVAGSLVATGSVLAAGGGGTGGLFDGCDGGGGGGGGAGGAVLVEYADGAALAAFDVRGGGGGAGADDFTEAARGADGSDGGAGGASGDFGAGGGGNGGDGDLEAGAPGQNSLAGTGAGGGGGGGGTVNVSELF